MGGEAKKEGEKEGSVDVGRQGVVRPEGRPVCDEGLNSRGGSKRVFDWKEQKKTTTKRNRNQREVMGKGGQKLGNKGRDEPCA